MHLKMLLPRSNSVLVADVNATDVVVDRGIRLENLAQPTGTFLYSVLCTLSIISEML